MEYTPLERNNLEFAVNAGVSIPHAQTSIQYCRKNNIELAELPDYKSIKHANDDGWRKFSNSKFADIFYNIYSFDCTSLNLRPNPLKAEIILNNVVEVNIIAAPEPEMVIEQEPVKQEAVEQVIPQLPRLPKPAKYINGVEKFKEKYRISKGLQDYIHNNDLFGVCNWIDKMITKPTDRIKCKEWFCNSKAWNYTTDDIKYDWKQIVENAATEWGKTNNVPVYEAYNEKLVNAIVKGMMKEFWVPEIQNNKPVIELVTKYIADFMWLDKPIRGYADGEFTEWLNNPLYIINSINKNKIAKNKELVGLLQKYLKVKAQEKIRQSDKPLTDNDLKTYVIEFMKENRFTSYNQYDVARIANCNDNAQVKRVLENLHLTSDGITEVKTSKQKKQLYKYCPLLKQVVSGKITRTFAYKKAIVSIVGLYQGITYNELRNKVKLYFGSASNDLMQETVDYLVERGKIEKELINNYKTTFTTKT